MPKLTPERLQEIDKCLTEGWAPHDSWRQVVTDLWNERAELLAHIDATEPDAKLGADVRELFDSTDNDFMFFENAEGDGNFTVVANYQDRDHERMYTGHGLNEAAAAAVKAMRKEAE